jgi:urate oxidase
MAKKYPVDPIEEWAIHVAKDFMSRYSHITAVNLQVDQQSWERIRINGQEHNHAFRKGSSGVRFCEMRLSKSGQLSMTSGFRDLQVLKTTQSGFEGCILNILATN